MGHSPPSHSRSSTAASSKEHKPTVFSKGLYFTGQSSSKLQRLQTLAPWEAAMQPSGLRSGQPGYGSPGAAKMRAQPRCRLSRPTAEVPEAWGRGRVARCFAREALAWGTAALLRGQPAPQLLGGSARPAAQQLLS